MRWLARNPQFQIVHYLVALFLICMVCHGELVLRTAATGGQYLDAVIWDSLAILEYLADKVGRDRFWPKDEAARGMARAMVAEMHSSYMSLRTEMPMNVRRQTPLKNVSEETKSDIVRILQLWAEARARHGSAGPFLFGTFGAADIFYAPVVSRFLTYGIGVPGFAQSYMQAIWEHDWMREWVGASEAEEWVIEQYEAVG